MTATKRLDYQWALECWREMMAKYRAGRPRSASPPGPYDLYELLAKFVAWEALAGCDYINEGGWEALSGLAADARAEIAKARGEP